MSRRPFRMMAAMSAVMAGMSGPLLVTTLNPSPAFAAGPGVFVQPPPPGPFTVPVNTAGNPIPFTVSGTNFPAGPVAVEICDGLSPSDPNFNVNSDCDAASGNSTVNSAGPASTETFLATDPNVAIQPFRGQSQQDQFNCLAPEDVKAGTVAMANGSVTPVGPRALNGATIDPGNSSWTNCELRLSSNDSAVTPDQVFQAISLPNSGSRLSPTVGVAPQVGTVPQNTPTTITATVSGTGATPTGTVNFNDNVGGTSLVVPGCGAVAVGVAGVATCNSTGLLLGNNAVTANYAGDGVYGAASSPPVTYVATKALIATTTTLSSVPATHATPGSSVTLTATVTPTSGTGSPTGTVDFQSKGADISTACATATIAAGKATCTTAALATGTDALTAKYSGDTNFSTSTGTESFTVMVLPVPTITLTPAPASPGTFGASVTVNATLTGASGAVTGTLGFTIGGVAVTGCTAQPITAGAASCALPKLAVGANSLGAVYTPDAASAYGTATAAAITYTVNQAAPTVALTSVPAAKAAPGTSVTLTATVTGAAGVAVPTGTVDFKSGNVDITGCATQAITTIASAQVATCTTTTLATAVDNLTATYSGDGNYIAGIPGTEAFTVMVLPLPTIVLTPTPASPSTYGTSVNVGAMLTGASGTVTGTVAFTLGGVAITGCTAQPITAGAASCALPKLSGGSSSLGAVYTPDAASAYGTATATPITYMVTPATPTVTLAASPPATAGQGLPVTLTATVTGVTGATAPSGVVDFKSGPTDITGCTTQAITAGQATCTTTTMATGTDSLTAVYAGDGNYLTLASAPTSYVVTPRSPTTVAVTAVPASPAIAGTSVTITATVSTGAVTTPLATGTVAFGVGGTPIAGCTASAVVPSSGSATCTTTALPVGADTVNATYSGDNAFTGSMGMLSYTVTQPAVTAGYLMVGRDGGVFAFGGAGFFGSLGGQHLNAPIVGLAGTTDQKGYWLVGADGQVFAFGDAAPLGSPASSQLKAPIVGIVATPTGHGYWVAGADGQVFAFGDASALGSLAGIHLNAPIVSIVATITGKGYWLIASDGGVFSFGDATFHGSLGSIRLNSPIVGGSFSPNGNGYLLVGGDGGVFAFGDAAFHGSLGGLHLNAPVVGISTAPEGGYRLDASDGGVFNFGGAGFFGSLGGLRLNSPITGLASTGH